MAFRFFANRSKRTHARIRDHDPRYCAGCQFWLAFYKASGALAGLVAAALGLAIVLGALALGGYFVIDYFAERPEKLALLVNKFWGLVAAVVFIFFAIILATGLTLKVKNWFSETTSS